MENAPSVPFWSDSVQNEKVVQLMVKESQCNMSDDHNNRYGIKPLVDRSDDYHKWAESIKWKLMEQDYLWEVTQGIKVQDLTQSHVSPLQAHRRFGPNGGP